MAVDQCAGCSAVVGHEHSYGATRRIAAAFRVRGARKVVAVDHWRVGRGHRCDALDCSAKHHSQHLQSSWGKHGQAAFEFLILELVPDVAMLIERENAHIARLCATDPNRGYNLRKDAGSQLGMRHSEGAKKKMSAAHKGRVKTPEHQAAINASLVGRVLSDEHRAKIAANQTSRKATEETRKKMRESQAAKVLSPESHKKMVTANVGRKFTEEHRQRIADANRRRVTSTETKAKISAARKRTEEMKKQTQSPLMGYALKCELAR